MGRCGLGRMWRDEDEMGVMGLAFFLVLGRLNRWLNYGTCEGDNAGVKGTKPKSAGIIDVGLKTASVVGKFIID